MKNREVLSNAGNLCRAAGASLLLQACGSPAPEPPPVVNELRVSIDANNNCRLEKEAVTCDTVAAAIRTRYPTSKPRVDICLAKETRYEAAAEVTKSVIDAGYTLGSFGCDKAPAGG